MVYRGPDQTHESSGCGVRSTNPTAGLLVLMNGLLSATPWNTSNSSPVNTVYIKDLSRESLLRCSECIFAYCYRTQHELWPEKLLVRSRDTERLPLSRPDQRCSIHLKTSQHCIIKCMNTHMLHYNALKPVAAFAHNWRGLEKEPEN